MSKAPHYAQLVSNASPSERSKSHVALYRSFLQHCRLVPDPHVWMVKIPPFRKACKRIASYTSNLGEGEMRRGQEGVGWTAERKAVALRASRQERCVKNLRKELAQLKAAVACHPHALSRLLEEAYAQRGALRYYLIQNIISSSDLIDAMRSDEYLLGPTRQAMPVPLHPLRPAPIPLSESATRSRKHVPQNAGKRKAVKAWHRNWKDTRVPLALPQTTGGKLNPSTGWEGHGVVDALRILSGVAGRSSPVPHEHITSPRDLPTFNHLTPVLQRIFPSKSKPSLREPVFPQPPPRMVRCNPNKWRRPVRLDARLLRRTYARLWESLSWVRPAKDGWVKCHYGQIPQDSLPLTPAAVSPSDEVGDDGHVSYVVEAASGKIVLCGDGEEKQTGPRQGSRRWTIASEEDLRWIG